MDKDAILSEVELVTPSAPPNTGRIPTWVLEEVITWIEGARTGDLELHFEAGIPKHFRYSGIVNPLRGDVPGGYNPIRWTHPPVCPTDGKPLAERDYGERFQCSQCDRTWTYWQLIKMREAWAPDQWAEIMRRKPSNGR